MREAYEDWIQKSKLEFSMFEVVVSGELQDWIIRCCIKSPVLDALYQLKVLLQFLEKLQESLQIKNDKARRYFSSMKMEVLVSLSQTFPDIDSSALRLLECLIAFDPKNHPSAEEALAHLYFRGLVNKEREPSARPIPKFEFDFERRKLAKVDITELIYWEISEYHLQMLLEYLHGTEHTSFLYPSVFAMVITLIWRERNAIRFKQTRFEADHICREIILHMHLRSNKINKWKQALQQLNSY